MFRGLFHPADAGALAAGGKWMVSRCESRGMVYWRADGKELYFLTTDLKVMAVEVDSGSGFHAGAPVTLFQVPSALLRAPTPSALGAVTQDGQRFLFAIPVPRGVHGRPELARSAKEVTSIAWL